MSKKSKTKTTTATAATTAAVAKSAATVGIDNQADITTESTIGTSTAPFPIRQAPPAALPGNVRPGTFERHKHPDYPDGPDLDPEFGTKTPEFVEWRRRKAEGLKA